MKGLFEASSISKPYFVTLRLFSCILFDSVNPIGKGNEASEACIIRRCACRLSPPFISVPMTSGRKIGVDGEESSVHRLHKPPPPPPSQRVIDVASLRLAQPAANIQADHHHTTTSERQGERVPPNQDKKRRSPTSRRRMVLSFLGARRFRKSALTCVTNVAHLT